MPFGERCKFSHKVRTMLAEEIADPTLEEDSADFTAGISMQPQQEHEETFRVLREVFDDEGPEDRARAALVSEEPGRYTGLELVPQVGNSP